MKHITGLIVIISNQIIRCLTFFFNLWHHSIIPRYLHYNHPSIHKTAVVYKPILFRPQGVTLERGVYIFKNARIQCVINFLDEIFDPHLIIKERTSIQQNVHITCGGKISIGKYCSITHNVTITDIDHTYEYTPHNTPPRFNKLEINEVHIGDYCMIFPNSVILGKTNIGNNVVIAANSVVRGSFPDNCLIGGIPAVILKKYNPISDKWEKTNPDGTFIENLD